MRLVLILLASLLLLLGCANQALKPQANVSAAALNEAQGVLIGSFARDPTGPKYFGQWFYFKNVTTGTLHELHSQPTFNLFSGKTPDDFTSEQSNGAVFALTLPAGTYAFYNFRLYQASGYFQQNWRSKEDYAIQFEVHPGRVNYVGEIKIVTTMGKNFFGMPVPAGGIWIITDQRERDVRLLGLLHSNVPTTDVVTVIPNSKQRFTPLVVLPSEKNLSASPSQ